MCRCLGACVVVIGKRVLSLSLPLKFNSVRKAILIAEREQLMVPPCLVKKKKQPKGRLHENRDTKTRHSDERQASFIINPNS